MVRRKKVDRSWFNVLVNVSAFLCSTAGWIQIGLYLGFGLIVFAGAGVVDRVWFSPDEITPVQARVPGWDAELAKATGPAIAASQPKFAVRDENGAIVSSKGSYAELWKYEKIANNGKFLLLPPQETGDCASYAVTQGVTRRHAVQIVNSKSNEKLLSPFPPELYGVGRHQIGKDRFGRGAGCTVGEILQGAQGYGLYSWEQAERDGFRYSGQLADIWGARGPPKKVLDVARKVRLRTFSAVQTWDDIVDAIANGYPVPFGAAMVFRRDTQAADGKRWLQFDSSVPPRNRGHAQVLIGIEDRPGKRPGAYCLGSWGPDAHDRPLNGEPPGGGWVDRRLVEQFILTGHDAYAISDSDTFEVKAEQAAEADWNAFAPPEINDNEVAEKLAAVDQPEEPFLLEKRKMFPLELLVPLLCLGLLLVTGLLFAKFSGPRTRVLGAILVGACLLGIADRAVEAGNRKRAARLQAFAAQCACPAGACAAGNCAGNGCVNGQCAVASTPATATTERVQYQWKCDGKSCRLVPIQAAEVKAPAAEKPNVPSAGGERLFRANGDGTWSDAVEAAELEAMEKDMQLASAEKVPSAIWNAFQPAEPGPQVWTAFPTPSRELRTYSDCYEHEPEFILVVGTEESALFELEHANNPVAHESSLKGIKQGAYRFVKTDGKLTYTPLGKPPALNSVTSRK